MSVPVIYITVLMLVWIIGVVLTAIYDSSDDRYEVGTHATILVFAIAWPMILPLLIVYGLGCALAWSIRYILYGGE